MTYGPMVRVPSIVVEQSHSVCRHVFRGHVSLRQCSLYLLGSDSVPQTDQVGRWQRLLIVHAQRREEIYASEEKESPRIPLPKRLGTEGPQERNSARLQ